MKRRRSMVLLIGGVFFTGCRREEPLVEAPVEEERWIRMKDEWEWVSGGQVDERDGELRIGWGEALTAVRWKGDLPTAAFELELEAKRVDGTDFFCAVTFPARGVDECVTLIVGGWGGGLVGISSIDGRDASENETRTVLSLQNEAWYRIRLVREGERIATWIDGDKVVDVDTTDKGLSLRAGPIEDCAPFGLATWQSTGMVRNVRWRRL